MGTLQQVSLLKGLGGPGAVRTHLHRLFEANAASKDHSERTALIYQDNGDTRTWTMSQLDTAANRMARVILKKVAKSSPNSDGDCPIAVALPPSDELVITLLAIWKAGGAYLPLDMCAPPERLSHILNEAKPLLVITKNEGVSHKPCETVTFAQLLKESANVSSALVPASEALPSVGKMVAIILYTSGSTGVPKGVRVLHSAILNRLKWQWREFPYSAEEKICVFKTALTFVDHVSEIWGPLLYSDPRSLVVVPRAVTKNPEALTNLLDKYKVERLVLVPTFLRTLLMYLNLSKGENHLRHLRLWICSGETLSPSLALEFMQHFPNGHHVLCNFYGSTEIMGDVSYHVIRRKEDVEHEGKVPIGAPVDNTILYLLNQDMKVVPAGEAGELYVSGRNLAAGYVNGRDAFRFMDNPHAVDPDHGVLFRTGDYAKVVKGTLLFEGRTDSQVKVRGQRVDLSEIDNALSKVKGIQKSITLCYKPGEIDQAVVSFILPDENVSITDSEVEKSLQSHLQDYAMPLVVIVQHIPLLVNGKIDRQYLLSHYESRVNHNEDCSFDFTGVPSEKIGAAEVLFKTIQSVLAGSIKGKVNGAANFYKLGGNSLNTVYTVSKLKDYGYNISISDFIYAKILLDAIMKMSLESPQKSPHSSSTKFTAVQVTDNEKDDVIRLITDSFYEKADLERLLEPLCPPGDYKVLLESIWDPLVDEGLSFVVKAGGEIVGVSLNFDALNEPNVEINTRLCIVLDFLEYLEGPLRARKLPQSKGKIFHSFMMGTEKRLSGPENVEVIEFMEEENIRVARSHGFEGIFTTNSSPLTMQLGTDVFHYTVLLEYQINQYVAADGTRPFRKAPNSQVVKSCWKLV